MRLGGLLTRSGVRPDTVRRNRTDTRVPTPDALSIAMEPPCSSAKPLTSARFVTPEKALRMEDSSRTTAPNADGVNLSSRS